MYQYSSVYSPYILNSFTICSYFIDCPVNSTMTYFSKKKNIFCIKEFMHEEISSVLIFCQNCTINRRNEKKK